MEDAAEVTGLLLAWSSGDETARNRLFEAVYAELRRLASALEREPDWTSLPTPTHRSPPGRSMGGGAPLSGRSSQSAAG
jgi:ECF sigma factor